MISMDFLITSLIVVLLPGTGVIYTVSTGLSQGGKKSLVAASGCTMGIVPHLMASVLGLSAVMHMSSVAFQCMKYAGALYLFYLAWSMWKESGGLRFDDRADQTSWKKLIVRGFLINILNPKLSLFFLAFLPLFVQAENQIAPICQLLFLSAVFMAMTFIVFAAYGYGAHLVRRYIASSWLLTFVQRSFAFCLAFFGIKVLLFERE